MIIINKEYTMPRKTVKQHGSQAGEQTKTEYYKSFENYKELKLVDDEISKNISHKLRYNYWDLEKKFNELEIYYQQIGISNIISWKQGIQYLDIIGGVATRNTSIQAFKRGDYKAIGTDKPNSITTEKGYADRLIFYTRTFEPFRKYMNKDNFNWVLTDNRQLLYEILNYNNSKQNQLTTVNGDLKTIIRAIKIVLENPEHEIRWKYSALQIALGDLDRLKDDLNQVLSVNELKSFIPYEQLIELVDTLDSNYRSAINALPDNIKNNPSKHPNEVVFLNQVLIAVAINVLDFPSRLDKFEMEYIVDETQVQPNKCYILLTNPITFIFNNNKKKHKPLKYKLDAIPILGFNKRLNDLLIESFSNYPRLSLFIKKDTWNSQLLTPVNEATVSEWIRKLLPNKTLNIGTFRSSFVSYYYPKFNNQQKKLMTVRMRTSIDEINRAYLKFYNNPDTLAKVKIEPSTELLEKTKSGQIDTPIIINNVKIKQEPTEEIIQSNTPLIIQPVINIQDRRRENAKKWYSNPDNKERHKNKVKEHSKLSSTYRRRFIRELNSGVMDFNRIKPETKEKYNIKFENGIYA